MLLNPSDLRNQHSSLDLMVLNRNAGQSHLPNIRLDSNVKRFNPVLFRALGMKAESGEREKITFSLKIQSKEVCHLPSKIKKPPGIPRGLLIDPLRQTSDGFQTSLLG